LIEGTAYMCSKQCPINNGNMAEFLKSVEGISKSKKKMGKLCYSEIII
jgi:hypothetical protein